MSSASSLFLAPKEERVEPLILVEEISHRVVNEYCQAIAGLRLAAADIASAEARDALVSAAKRLREFAEAHQALRAPASGELTDLGAYLERLCLAVSRANLNDRGVRLTLIAETIILPADRCWRAALIVSELITNALRHGLRGGPGNICVEVALAGRQVVCRVSDSGAGDTTASPARGSAIIRALAAELDGEAHWRLGPGGSSAQLIFPHDTGRRLG